MLFVLGTFCFWTLFQGIAPHPEVKLSVGTFVGRQLTSSICGCRYSSFKGIPYATPPLGKLRFKAPKPIEGYLGKRNALEHGPICVQYLNTTSDIVVGEEDCLYLNVYSPSDASAAHPRSVMVFFHGGYFITGSGSSDLYGPDFLMCHSVLLVTVNYRLGPLGFLSVDTEGVPGNAGMQDQVAALRWVKTNIHKLGGDPNKVTIFGPSSGGASVSLHILSPQSKGFFHRAVSMSSIFFSDSSTSYKHLERAYALGCEVGCNNTDANGLVNCLRQVPSKKLFEARPNIKSLDGISNSLLKTVYFTPVVEKKFNDQQFLTECPGKLLCKGQVNKVEFMIGHTQSEGLWTTSLVIDDILKYYPKFKVLYVPTMISNIRCDQKVSELADRIKDNYITKVTLLDSINGFVNYSTYANYVYGIHNFNDRYKTVNNKNHYFYLFALNASTNYCYQDGKNTFGIKKTTHLDDLPLLFSGSTTHKMPVTEESDLYKYINLMCTLYTNFAKFGNPTPDMSWPQYGKERNYLTIADTLTVGQVQPYSGNLGFWQNIYQDAGVRPYLN